MFKTLANLFKSRVPTTKPRVLVASPSATAPPPSYAYDHSQNSELYNNSAVYCCINTISTSVASISLTARRTSESLTSPTVDSELRQLERLLRQPNPTQSQTPLIKELVASYLLEGNSYLLGTFNPGDLLPRQINVLKPSRMQIIPDEYGTPKGYIYTVGNRSQQINFTEQILTPDGRTRSIRRILHLKNFNPTHNSHGDFYGHSPLEAARQPITHMNLFDRRNTGSIATSRGPSAIVSCTNPLKFISDQERAEVAHSIALALSQEGGVFFLNNEYNIQFLEDPSAKHRTDYEESTVGPARRIAQVLGVPHEIIGLAESRDLNQSHKLQQFWCHRVLPLVKEIALALDNWLCPAFDHRITIQHTEEDVPKFR